MTYLARQVEIDRLRKVFEGAEPMSPCAPSGRTGDKPLTGTKSDREVISPACTVEGSKEWMAAGAKLARSWAESAAVDARALIEHLRDLRRHNWQALIAGVDDWNRFCRETLGKPPEFIACLEEAVRALEPGAANGKPVTRVTGGPPRPTRPQLARRPAGATGKKE
jgi:hypothetical protein